MSADKYLIKNARILRPGSSTKQDVLIEGGIITRIDDSVDAGTANVVDAQNGYLSAGWFDLRCRLADPGFEWREDLKSGTDAAAAGGFTEIACLPDTFPLIESKSQIDYIKHHTKDFLTRVYPLGAASAALEGTELSEMYDMHRAGAIAFSNADVPFHDPGYLLRALMYVQPFGGLIMTHAEDTSLSKSGLVNESINTIYSGIKTAPRMAESTSVQTQIELAAYAKSPIHFSHVSTRESVELIRMAKNRGIKVTADVAIIHLIYTDEKVNTFNTNYKIKPPLRAEPDRKALIDAVNDGTIDAIVTDHYPVNIELKDVEFDYAAWGITGFQTFYPLFNTFLSKEISVETWIEKVVNGPRRILGLPTPEIKEGFEANLTVFNPDMSWQFDKKSNYSKSENSPFFGQQLKGKILFTANHYKSFNTPF